MSLARRLQEQWFDPKRRLVPALWFLLPLVPLFAAVAALHRLAFRLGLLKRDCLPIPVLVIGNLTVGGAGKTPLTLALAQQLLARGRRPGIVSRGYGRGDETVRRVLPADDAAAVGDEPLLLARRSGVPVWVGRRRAEAARALLRVHPEVDVLLCDDGLQHYALARDFEIAVFDRRGVGSGRLLPLGPLREPLTRLDDVDAVVLNDCAQLAGVSLPADLPTFPMQLRAGTPYRLAAPQQSCEIADLRERPLHAVAGIGDPARFFATLAALGLSFEAHPFPDHHAYVASDFAFGEGAVVLMTEKDAVKCATICPGEAWVLPVEATVPPALADLILEKIRGRKAA
jgi:tetraacyldisaccharide 4'-kinase